MSYVNVMDEKKYTHTIAMKWGEMEPNEWMNEWI